MKQLLYVGLVSAALIVGGCSSQPATENHTEEDHVHDELAEDHDHDSESEEHIHAEGEVHDHEHESEDHDHKGGESDEHDHEHEGAITFTHEQAERIEFETAYPEYKPFGPVIKTTAVAQVSPTQQMVLTASTSGVVQFLSSAYVEGNSVNAQTILFSITGSGMGADNAALVYSSALTNYETEKANYERVQQLAEKQIVSQKELLESKSSFDQAKAVYENLQQNYSSTGQTVSAPFSGNIAQVFVENGQYVNAGEPVVSVMNGQKLQLRAEVQQKYAAALKQISDVFVKAPSQESWTSLGNYNGKLVSVGAQVSSQSFLLPVVFDIENNGDILPGSFVDLNLQTTSETEQVVIPNSALIEQQGNYFVYVEIEQELYSKTQVQIGVTDGTYTAIKSGVHADDLIVTKGAVMVKLASASGSLDPHAGHVH